MFLSPGSEKVGEAGALEDQFYSCGCKWILHLQGQRALTGIMIRLPGFVVWFRGVAPCLVQGAGLEDGVDSVPEGATRSLWYHNSSVERSRVVKACCPSCVCVQEMLTPARVCPGRANLCRRSVCIQPSPLAPRQNRRRI